MSIQESTKALYAHAMDTLVARAREGNLNAVAVLKSTLVELYDDMVDTNYEMAIQTEELATKIKAK